MNPQQRVDDWNAKYPPGTPVHLVNDDQQVEHTHTRTPAWLLGDGTPVVSVEGRTGGYLMDRISVVVYCGGLRVVESREFGQGNVFCAEFSVKVNSSQSDAELFRAAAEWLDVHPDTTLLGLSFNDSGNIDEPSAKLCLFVEE